MRCFSIGYCWIAKGHPDPEGYLLATRAEIFGIFKHHGRPSENACSHCGQGVLVDDLLSRGFGPGSGDGRLVGIFLDWACLFQMSRSDEET